MIDTQTIKDSTRNVFETGSGETNILIVGSCRCVPYINYLDRYNKVYNQPFDIFVIEPNNYHWDDRGGTVNLEEVLTKLETDERVLSVLRNTQIFIHEHYSNFGMFNTSKDSPKNIYQFGMSPDQDIAIPNWHDHLILQNDYIAYSSQAPEDYIEKGEAEIDKFCLVCELSSFPEFGIDFRENWRNVRFFWRPNHISAAFSLSIFRLMNEKFLHLTMNGDFWNAISQEDMYREPHTIVTQLDIEGYNLEWDVL